MQKIFKPVSVKRENKNPGDIMTEENWVKITVYDPSMAAKAAELFNAFNEMWPGGFGGGSPYDEQRVRDWLDETSAIADLVASAEVDRYGWGVSGIERILDGEKLSVKTRLRSHEILMGVPNALTIEIVNETGKDINIGLTVEPFAGLEWVSSIPSSVAVKNGEKSEQRVRISGTRKRNLSAKYV